MRMPRTPRRALIATVTAVWLCTGVTVAGAAPATQARPPASGATTTHPYRQLLPFAELSADRLLTADLVAAAKWGTGGPIDDPVRERQVLEAVARQAVDAGADPRLTVRIFRDQIEANKAVQRGLFARWAADPAGAPTDRPDLARVREEINRLNSALVLTIADTAGARAGRSCTGLLTAGAVRVAHDRRLDALHTGALARALPSVCERPAR